LADDYATRYVTVRDMLCHRTGLPRHEMTWTGADLEAGEFIQRLRHLQPSASFREKYQYTNLFYCIIPALVERLAAVPWEDFVAERIFKPLGMHASNFSPEYPGAGNPLVEGYRADWNDDGSFRELIKVGLGRYRGISPGGSGALFTTLKDLSHWLRLHVQDGCFGGQRIVSTKNLQQMHQPQVVMPAGNPSDVDGSTIQAYGLGWEIQDYRGYCVVHHSGAIVGACAKVGFIPEEKLTFVALSNLRHIPLPDLLMYESFDRALGLETRDWSQRFHARLDPMIRAMAADRKESNDRRVADAPATHPPEAYAGIYSAPGYPDIGIRLHEGGLQCCLLGSFDWSPLAHCHYDVFEWFLDEYDISARLRFSMNEDGEIDALAAPMEPNVGDIIFRRRAGKPKSAEV
jgi:CubicO group peptidase (beta-lactamase class C family)